MLETLIQYYPNTVNAYNAMGVLSLGRLLDKIKNPNPDTIEIYNQIEEATKNGEEDKRSELKKKLYSFTPCVFTNGRRRYVDILSFTGLIALDFDKIDNAPEFRDYLINEYQFIIAAWLSSSRKGVRALVHSKQVETVQEFKKMYAALADNFDMYDGFDYAPRNCVLLLFLSYDPDIKTNPINDRYKWTDSREIENDINTAVRLPYRPIESTDLDIKRIEGLTKSGIDKITDNGHPQLMAVAVALGGYVGANYLSENDANGLIIRLIESNIYLSKKPKVYIKTAGEQIKYGMFRPLYLSN